MAQVTTAPSAGEEGREEGRDGHNDSSLLI